MLINCDKSLNVVKSLLDGQPAGDGGTAVYTSIKLPNFKAG